MKPARIEYELEGHRVAAYENDFDWGEFARCFEGRIPALIIAVEDADDAAALVAAIEKVDRSPPKKERKRKPSVSAPVADPDTPPGDAAGAGNGCEVPGCKYDADHGQKRCREHAKAVANG